MSDEPAHGEVAGESLDQRVRRVDLDRWLASRFISDPTDRANAVAIYALDDELARVGPSVSQSLIGEIRLTWWRERLQAIAAGETPLGHPVLQAIAPALASSQLPISIIEAMVEARGADLDVAPFTDDGDLARYLDGTAGAVIGLAARALEPEAPLRAVVEAGRAWGLARLYRSRSVWEERGRRWFPTSWGALDDADVAARVAAEVDAASRRAREQLKALSIGAFPAVAYVTLAQPYARGRAPGELERRLRLLGAVLAGRI